MDANAADHEPAVDHRNTLTQLCGADGPLLTGRAAADNDQVVIVVIVHEGAIRSFHPQR